MYLASAGTGATKRANVFGKCANVFRQRQASTGRKTVINALMVVVVKKCVRTAGDTHDANGRPGPYGVRGPTQTDARGQFERPKCVGPQEMP
jgi:hypothetical protein